MESLVIFFRGISQCMVVAMGCVCRGQLISWTLLEEAVRAQAQGLLYPSSDSVDRSLIIYVGIPLPTSQSALFWVPETSKHNSVITIFLIQKSVE